MTDPRKNGPVQFPEVGEVAWKTSDFSVSRAGTIVSLLLNASARNRAGTILQVGERRAGASVALRKVVPVPFSRYALQRLGGCVFSWGRAGTILAKEAERWAGDSPCFRGWPRLVLRGTGSSLQGHIRLEVRAHSCTLFWTSRVRLRMRALEAGWVSLYGRLFGPASRHFNCVRVTTYAKEQNTPSLISGDLVNSWACISAH